MKLNFSKILLSLEFLILSVMTAVVATSLTKAGWAIYFVFFLFTIFRRRLKQSCLSIPFFFLPFACAFDVNSVLLIFLSAILFSKLLSEKKNTSYALPFFTILMLTGWLIQNYLDLQDIVYIIKQYSLGTWLRTVGMGLGWYRGFVQITLWCVGYSFFCSLSKDEELRLLSLKNIFYGSILAVLSFVFQPLFMPKFYAGMNDYWLMTGRMSGSFSDPNSAGISLFIISFLIIYALKKVYFKRQTIFLKLLLFFVLLVALFSGSRSFILGVVASFLVLLFIRKKVLFNWILGSVLLVFALINIATFYFGTEWISSLPISLQRTANTLYLPNTLEMLSSRLLFWEIGWKIFKDNWLAGIGVDRFYDFFPYYTLLSGYEPSGWSDSACSFIFGVLTDGGLLLVVALLYSFRSLKFQKTSENIEVKNNKVLIACLLGYCVIHLSSHLLIFEEVFLFALLSSFVLKFNEKKKNVLMYPLLFIVVCVYGYYQYRSVSNFYGLYKYEVKGTELNAISKRSLNFILPCINVNDGVNNKKEATLKFSFLRPRRDRDVMIVGYKTPLEENKFEIKKRDIVIKKLDCDKEDFLPIQMKASKAWLRGNPNNLDPRLMCMRLYFEKCGKKWCLPILNKGL